MMRKEYSAGAVKHSFWFSEFRKIIMLLLSGNSMDDIKVMNQNNNIFAAPTAARATQIYNTVSNRVRSLDSDFYPFFDGGELATQKIINLIAIMNTDTLFFDFVHDVYREKLILGDSELHDSDIRVFFKNKQMQDERVAMWKDYTLKRLGTCYKTFLVEAGVAKRDSDIVIITKPVLDPSLAGCLRKHGMEQFENALMGVR
jgi:hypothetical protein